MRTGASLALICIGAILAFAVTANTSFLNVHTAGYVLIIIGIVGLYFNRRGWSGRQLLTRRSTRTIPGVVETRRVPRYWKRNPGTAAARAGLPAVPSIEDPPEEYVAVPDLPPEAQVVEEEYFEE